MIKDEFDHFAETLAEIIQIIWSKRSDPVAKKFWIRIYNSVIPT
jgi:hypothetical protein